MTTQTIPSDLEIAQAATLRPIEEIAEKMGLSREDIELHGNYMAKIHLEALEKLQGSPQCPLYSCHGHHADTTGRRQVDDDGRPGPGDAAHRQAATIAIRQPSQGPTFGIKGGAAGGGYSQVVPMEQFNLHMTGDIHAVTAANNLLAAMIDNHIYQGNALNIDPYSITWRRVLDVNDRELRNIVAGLGGKSRWTPAADAASTSASPAK